ncbi:MAG: hypothetical protein C0469_08065 [Cyanobacteria bacterium DS2.3.42]|nr:hypothetical protein [Cyanobacteria bacterium DS2.3.42]
MIFSSLQYLVFLPIVAMLYWRTTGGARLALVVLASYFFYMSWLPVYGLLLLGLTIVNFAVAIAIDKTRPAGEAIDDTVDASIAVKSKEADYLKRKSLLHKSIFAFGVILNIGTLIYYKYANFLIENIVGMYNIAIAQSHALPIFKIAAPLPWDKPVLDVILPLGISFFIFEFVHYLVDVYRGDKALRSFMEFAAFASFFPSQIAGPIKRYKDFMEKLRRPDPLTQAQFTEGATLIVQGLFKKVAIADPLGFIIAHPFATSTALSASDAWIAAAGFCIQVYCDFSGYTDIGRGSALWLGIRLPENFALPFFAHDLLDFWRRWHMSLSNWLRDYVYIPMGGNRIALHLQWRNLFLTMIACGIWHGASWHYVIFGAIQGVGLCVNKEWRGLLQKSKTLKSICESKPGLVFANFLLLLFIVPTYSIFRSPDIAHSINMLTSMFNFGAPCTLAAAIDKSGVVYISSVYFLFWLVADRLTKSEFFMSVLTTLGLSADGKTFAMPVRLASWTAACVLMFAAKPTDAIPFVYFQF